MVKKIFHCGMMLLAMALATSCSNDKMSKLLDRVPLNSETVLVVDIATFTQSAGGDIKGGQINLPSSIENELPGKVAKELEDFNEDLKEAGIDPEAVCFVSNRKFLEYHNLFIFKIDDKKKLESFLDDRRYREGLDDDDLTIYVCKEETGWSGSYKSYMAVKDSYAYYMPDVYSYDDMSFNAERSIEKFIEAAAEEPMGSSAAAKYVAKGNAAGIIFHVTKNLREDMPSELKKYVEGFYCVKLDLGDNDLTMTGKLFNEEGKEKKWEDFGNFMDMNATIDKEALTYLGNNENVVAAVSMKDVKWNKYLDKMDEMLRLSRSERAAMDVAGGYLQKLDGTLAVGVGIKGGIEALADLNMGYKPMEAMSFTLVAQTKDNKAKGVINELKTMLDSYNIPYESKGSGFSLKLEEGFNLFVEAKGNYVIIANHKISQGVNEAVKAINMSDYFAAGAVVFTKDNRLMSDLGIENNMKATYTVDSKLCELTIKAEIEGGKAKGFVAKMLNIVIEVASKKKAIERKYEKRLDEIRAERYSSYGYGYYDGYATEEAAEAVEDNYSWGDSVATATDYVDW